MKHQWVPIQYKFEWQGCDPLTWGKVKSLNNIGCGTVVIVHINRTTFKFADVKSDYLNILNKYWSWIHGKIDTNTWVFARTENKGKPLKVRRYIGTVSFNNITRLTFGKRFINDKGELDPLGKEFKGILSSGFKSNKTSFLAEHLPWLRWLLVPLDTEKGDAAMHNARLDRFTREIMEEHAKVKSKDVGGIKQHFVDALLGLKDEYDLSEDTVIGLLWVRIYAF